MPQVQGVQASFRMYEESAYGQVPGVLEPVKLYLRRFGVQATRNQIDSETLNPERVRSRPIRGNWDVAGALEAEVAPESIGPLLKHAIGGYAKTGAGPYEHVFKPGSLPVGFVLEKDYGPDIVTGRYEQFLGCRIASLELSGGAEGFLLATINVRGAKALPPADASLGGVLADPGHTPFSMFAVTIEEGGAPIATVRNFRMVVDNALDDSSFAIGGQGVRRALPASYLSITGEIETLFESISLYQKAIAGTASSLRLTAQNGTGDGTAGNEKLDVLIEHLEYAPQSPAIDGPLGVALTAPYRAFKQGADLGLTVTLDNAVETLI